MKRKRRPRKPVIFKAPKLLRAAERDLAEQKAIFAKRWLAQLKAEDGPPKPRRMW